MLEYYKNKMNKAYKLCQKATDEGDEELAEILMADYLNYKKMYEGKLSNS